MKFKKVVLFLVFVFPLSLYAQNPSPCVTAQFDLAARWVWRGASYSETPVIQPVFGYSGQKLKLLVFGSYPIERRAYSEIDFTAEYQLFNFMRIGFTDYFAINDSLGARHNFFDMERKTSMHMFDVYATVSPFRGIPLSVLYSLWFWGADRQPETLRQNFSQYVEIKYEKEVGEYTATAFAGATLGKGFYARRAAFVNVGFGLSRTVCLTKTLSLPMKFEFVLNPELQNVYLNFIIGLK